MDEEMYVPFSPVLQQPGVGKENSHDMPHSNNSEDLF